jgi:hypothetical protein
MLGEQNRQNRISVKIKTVFIDADAFMLYTGREMDIILKQGRLVKKL